MNIKWFAALAVFAVFQGCSNPQQASRDNFKQSVQAYLDKAYPRCYFTENFPVTTGPGPMSSDEGILRLLAKSGLLEEKDTGAKKPAASGGFGFDAGAKTVPVYAYDLTEEGRKYYTPEAETRMGGNKVGGFCFGKAKVLSIDPFTEPGDAMGQKVARVSYAYSVGGFPEWAKDGQLKSALKGLKADVESDSNPIKESRDLVLTGNGWVLEGFVK